MKTLVLLAVLLHVARTALHRRSTWDWCAISPLMVPEVGVEPTRF
jgi:hypothetical protein